jgi:hypothetical protein
MAIESRVTPNLDMALRDGASAEFSVAVADGELRASTPRGEAAEPVRKSSVGSVGSARLAAC